MALVQDSTGLFLDSSTGQYFSPYTAPRAAPQRGYMSMSGFVPLPSFGNAGMADLGMPQPSGLINSNDPRQELRDIFRTDSTPQGLVNSSGQSFVPFTGNQQGISAGKRSVVDSLVGNRQPFQYNAPSLAGLFPMLQGNMQGGMPMQGMQNNMGAGKFMGGLLGSMPTPESSVTTPAPSSGAGRFL